MLMAMNNTMHQSPILHPHDLGAATSSEQRPNNNLMTNFLGGVSSGSLDPTRSRYHPNQMAFDSSMLQHANSYDQNSGGMIGGGAVDHQLQGGSSSDDLNHSAAFFSSRDAAMLNEYRGVNLDDYKDLDENGSDCADYSDHGSSYLGGEGSGRPRTELPVITDCNLYIKNIDYDITDDILFNVFSQIGEITGHHIVRDASNRSRGFAFMSFRTADEAKRAIVEMNGRFLGKKPIVVMLHIRKEQRRTLKQIMKASLDPLIGGGNNLQYQQQQISGGSGGMIMGAGSGGQSQNSYNNSGIMLNSSGGPMGVLGVPRGTRTIQGAYPAGPGGIGMGGRGGGGGYSGIGNGPPQQGGGAFYNDNTNLSGGEAAGGGYRGGGGGRSYGEGVSPSPQQSRANGPSSASSGPPRTGGSRSSKINMNDEPASITAEIITQMSQIRQLQLDLAMQQQYEIQQASRGTVKSNSKFEDERKRQLRLQQQQFIDHQLQGVMDSLQQLRGVQQEHFENLQAHHIATTTNAYRQSQSSYSSQPSNSPRGLPGGSGGSLTRSTHSAPGGGGGPRHNQGNGGGMIMIGGQQQQGNGGMSGQANSSDFMSAMNDPRNRGMAMPGNVGGGRLNGPPPSSIPPPPPPAGFLFASSAAVPGGGGNNNGGPSDAASGNFLGQQQRGAGGVDFFQGGFPNNSGGGAVVDHLPHHSDHFSSLLGGFDNNKLDSLNIGNVGGALSNHHTSNRSNGGGDSPLDPQVDPPFAPRYSPPPPAGAAASGGAVGDSSSSPLILSSSPPYPSSTVVGGGSHLLSDDPSAAASSNTTAASALHSGNSFLFDKPLPAAITTTTSPPSGGIIGRKIVSGSAGGEQQQEASRVSTPLRERLFSLIREKKPFVAKALTEFLVTNATTEELMQVLDNPVKLLPQYITVALDAMNNGPPAPVDDTIGVVTTDSPSTSRAV